MPLSPEDQAELDAIEAELARRAQPAAAAPGGGASETPLDPEERAELEAIEAELARRAATSGAGSPQAAPAVPAGPPPAAPRDAASPTPEDLMYGGAPTGAPAPAALPGSAPTPADYAAGYAAGVELKPELEKLPDWMMMPELWSVSKPQMAALLGTLGTTTPEETAQIIEKQLGVKSRPEGRYRVFMSSDGNEYAWKPGMRASDVGRALVAGGAAAGMTAAGAAAAGALLPAAVTGSVLAPIVGGAVGGIGTEAAMQTAQAATGGKFDTGDVLLSGVFGGAVPALGAAARGAKAAVAGETAESAARAAGQAFDDQATALGRASQAGGKAIDELGQKMDLDREALAAAERRGLPVRPDQVSNDPAFRSVARSASESVDDTPLVGSIRDNLKQAGAELDKGAFEVNTKLSVQSSLKDLATRSKAANTEVRNAIGRATQVDVPQSRAFLDQYKADLRSAKPPKILKALEELLSEERPSFLAWDSFRKDVGRATKGKGKFASTEPGLAAGLLKEMEGDFSTIAGKYGVGEKLVQAKELSKQSLAANQAVTSLFGRQLDKVIAGTGSAISSAVKGDTSNLFKLLDLVPKDQRGDFVSSVFSRALEKTEDLPQFVKLWDAMDANPQIKNLVMTSTTPEARSAIKDLVTAARGAVRAAGSKPDAARLKGVLPNPKLKAASKLLGAVIADAGLSSAGLSSGALSVAAGYALKGAETDSVKIAARFLAENSGALFAAASKPKPPDGLLKSIARTPSFQRFMTAAKVPPNLRRRWLEKTIANAARDAATPQTEEK